MQRGRGLPEFRHELIPCDFSTHLRPSVQRIQIQAFEGTDLDGGNTEIFDLWLRSFGNYCTMLSPTFQIRNRDTQTSCLETFESNITQVMSQSSSLERKWADHELSYPPTRGRTSLRELNRCVHAAFSEVYSKVLAQLQAHICQILFALGTMSH